LEVRERRVPVWPVHVCGISAGFVAPPICWVALLTVAGERQMSERRHTWSRSGQTRPCAARCACSDGNGNSAWHRVPGKRFELHRDASLENAQPQGLAGRRLSLRRNSSERRSVAGLCPGSGPGHEGRVTTATPFALHRWEPGQGAFGKPQWTPAPQVPSRARGGFRGGVHTFLRGRSMS